MEKRNNSDAYIAAEAVADRLRKTKEGAGKEYFDLIDEIKLLQKLYKKGYNLEKLEEFRKESDILGTMVDPKQVYGVGEELKNILFDEIIKQKSGRKNSYMRVAKRLILLESLEDPKKWLLEMNEKIRQKEEQGIKISESVLACLKLYEIKGINSPEMTKKFFSWCRERGTVQNSM